MKDPTCFTSCAASPDSLRHTSARRASSSSDQEIRLTNATKEFSRTILCAAEELDSRFLPFENSAENLTAAIYSPRKCERTPLILPPDGGARHRRPALSRLLQYSSEWKEVFVRAAEEGKRWWWWWGGAVIKLCKYSWGGSIINEALIRFDRTQCQRLDLPGRLLHLQTISHFTSPQQPTLTHGCPQGDADRHPELILASGPAMVLSHSDNPAPAVDTLTFFSSSKFY